MLTDEEIKNILESLPRDRFPAPEFARDIERAVLKKLGAEYHCFSCKIEHAINGNCQLCGIPLSVVHPLPAQAVPERGFIN